ncbi:MAG TPA: RNA polymerase sigma factor [Puia sp.]|nr:RNA polymerase sigma factor [Puia sp.]
MISTNAHLGILLEGCRNNDRASQKQLYELLNGFALKTCYAYSTDQIQDIVHEAFIKLFKNIHQFDEARYDDTLATLKGWFKRILINTCIDHFRKAASSNVRTLSKQAEEVADRSDNGFDMLSYKDILSAIRELTPAYRAVFNLFVMEGMSHEEIAAQLGISIGSSKSNLSKAREKLKMILAKKAEWNMHNNNFKIAAS